MYRGHPAVEVHETHASWVFLAGSFAYKVKKPVRLAFLDYSTLARRRAACQEEVRVNRELAPGIYIGVRAIVPAGEGLRFAPPDTPGAVEYTVHMRRFEEADTLQGAIETRSLTSEQVEEVARRVADFHRDCALCPGGEPERHRGEIERRVRAGEVRDGHGDLRCEHVLLGSEVRSCARVGSPPSTTTMLATCSNTGRHHSSSPGGRSEETRNPRLRCGSVVTPAVKWRGSSAAVPLPRT